MSQATLAAEPIAASDFSAVKSRQRAAWSSGDYAVVGSTLQIVGEQLCEALDLSAGETVLDVAAGNGNVSLAAARRFCEVTSTDYVGMLLDRGRARAAADGLSIAFREADAEDLPFPDASFDAVVSTFGVMFAPNHEQAASEMVRVCKVGGRIGLASWTPGGFIGQMFKTIARHLPPPAGLRSPALWGSREHIADLFGAAVKPRGIAKRTFTFRYRTSQHWLEVFKTYYGPVLKTFAALPPDAQSALADDLLALAEQFSRATDGTMAAPGEYLEVVLVKR